MKTASKVLWPAFALFCLAGCSSITIKGAAPQETPRALSEARVAANGARLTVRGKLLDKCPIAGCWFHLRDGNTTLRVDTKAAGFTVLGVPLQSEITVSGTVARNGGETVLQASGLRY